MSLTSTTHSSSTLSSSSCSASFQRQSYPTTTRQDPTHHHRRKVHSAPAVYSPSQSRKQASDLTLASSSTDYASDDSTVVAPSDDEKHITSKHLSAEDEFWANKINAELAAKSQAKANQEIAKAAAKAKRGCIGAIVDEFDFGFANVPSRGSKRGRKSAGGSELGKCELM